MRASKKVFVAKIVNPFSLLLSWVDHDYREQVLLGAGGVAGSNKPWRGGAKDNA